MEDDKMKRVLEQNGRLYAETLKHKFQDEDLQTQMELMRNDIKSIIDVMSMFLRTFRSECQDKEKRIPIALAIEALNAMKDDDQDISKQNSIPDPLDENTEATDVVLTLKGILKAKDEVIQTLQNEVEFLTSNQYSSPNQLEFDTNIDLCKLADQNSRMKLEIEQLKSDIEELEAVSTMKISSKDEEMTKILTLLTEERERITMNEKEYTKQAAEVENLKKCNQSLLQDQNNLLQANKNLKSIQQQADLKVQELERLNGNIKSKYDDLLKHLDEMQVEHSRALSSIREQELAMKKQELLAAGVPKKPERKISNPFDTDLINPFGGNDFFWRDEMNAVIEERNEVIGKQQDQIKSLTHQLHERKMHKTLMRN